MKKNRNGKRALVLFLAVSLLGTLLTGCGSRNNNKTEEESPEEVRIPIIFTVDPTTGKKNNQELADAFNKAYEGKY